MTWPRKFPRLGASANIGDDLELGARSAMELGILANTLVYAPRESAWSLAAVALGIPVYLYWQFQSKRPKGDDKE